MDLTALLAELCAVPAPTGAETQLADLLQDRWTSRCAEVRRDGVGNVIARVGGSGPRVLVQAHMDQIGYVVRHITDEGFLLLDGAQGDRRNGPERRHHVGQPVRALARDGAWVEGLLAAASGHVLTAEQRDEHRIGYDDFWVELGLRDRASVVALGLHPGAPVVFAGGMREIGRLLVGPSMDDRVGLAAMDALLHGVTEEELQCELWLAATVQEENGVHGARALARHHHWDAAVALDVGLVGDVPGGLGAPARDPPGRRPDRRPPRHGDHLRPRAHDAPARPRALAGPARAGRAVRRATAPTGWRSGSRARRRRC